MSRKHFTILGVVFLILFGAYAPSVLQPLLPFQNTAIGPYLNGAFTSETPTGPDSVTYTIENAFPNLTFIDPVKMLEFPSGEFFVLSKSGYAWVFPNDPNATSKTQVLDVSPNVIVGADGGMLGAALHPEFAQAGSANSNYLYIWYRYKPTNSTQGSIGYMRLSRFSINSSLTFIDPNSEYVLMQQFDRHDWHNGGDMFFGPDGFLYLAVGDEGGANDNYGRTQRVDQWLFGGVFRIDVDQQGGSISHPIRRQPINGVAPPPGWPNSFTQGYYIPNDNPWQDVNGGILEEFWALGTRSPHRMTYDPPTDDIWLGDVGQGTQEEISLVSSGANLQWPYKEGDANGPKAKPSPLIGYDRTPVLAYPRSFGTCVIGGYVIRGDKYPELEGKYVFGDQVVQNIWTLELGANGSAQNLQFLLNVPVEGVGSKDGISSFAMGSDSTLYILDLYGTALDGGKIHKLKRVVHGGTPEPVQQLSQLGVFTDLATLEPAQGVIRYELNTPLWSDGSIKKRWIALPNDGTFDTADEQIKFDADDFWEFPAGTVLIKHFDLPTDHNDPAQVQRLETRFFIYNDNGQAYGLTYRWNAAGTDAFLIDQEEFGAYQITKEDGSQFTQTWSFPSRQQCMDCHKPAAGYALGPKAHQLNRLVYYPNLNSEEDQLQLWSNEGMFDQAIPATDQIRKSYGILDLTASAEDRVLSYIDANCAHCHRDNEVNAAFDARYHLPLAQKNLVDEPAIGVNTPAGQKIIEFGDTLTSELWVRDNAAAGQNNIMPPLARSLVDEDYIAVLTEWILRSNMATVFADYTELNLKVLLEGPYGGGQMTDDLRSLSLIPNNEPYASLIGHAGQGGGEWVSDLSLDIDGTLSLIDWVLIELRDVVDPAIVLETRSALLLSDGRIIDPQGGPLKIVAAPASYYLAVRHRNHLGVMSAQPITLNNVDPVFIDFSDVNTLTWGTEAQKEQSGVQLMWMGDANGYAGLKYTGALNDRDAILLKIGGNVPTNIVGGYFREDANMDGLVRYTGLANDRDPVLLNIGGNVPTNIRVEQLP